MITTVTYKGVRKDFLTQTLIHLGLVVVLSSLFSIFAQFSDYTLTLQHLPFYGEGVGATIVLVMIFHACINYSSIHPLVLVLSGIILFLALIVLANGNPSLADTSTSLFQ